MPNTRPTAEESLLREGARDAIDLGRLPSRRPDRAWGTPGGGAAVCAVCARLITREQIEMEIGYEHNGARPGVDTYHLHLSCFAAWEFERVKTESTAT